jgi:hypothetical protein
MRHKDRMGDVSLREKIGLYMKGTAVSFVAMWEDQTTRPVLIGAGVVVVLLIGGGIYYATTE